NSDGTSDLHEEIVARLTLMLDEHNQLVKSFRMARERIQQHGQSDVKICLIGRRYSDGRCYNLPTSSEVAALVVGDFDQAMGERDILVETKSGRLQRINELNASYLALQYPLLLPYGEDGYREDIPFSDLREVKEDGRTTVSIREYFAYRIHDRNHEPSTILSARRLFQQFIVDAYTMVESSRLRYICFNQSRLRCDMYNGLADAVLRGDIDPRSRGKRIILPSSFTGGARNMIQNYQDAMAICRWAGYPDLFITFTCNPKWPEILRFLGPKNLRPEDLPDIVCRVFRSKLKQLIKDFREKQIFGEVKAVVYTVEFQKRGLPHAHILFFLAKANKFLDPSDIDKIISAEIPDETSDPYYYEAVKEHMIHGPCGLARKNSPCMVDGKCSKRFPKPFLELTSVDDDGYPRYRCRDNGRHIEKNGVVVHNGFVVPHNQKLLMKYGAHINVEWCNQSRSIKYLFKYVNKGNDRVTASFYQASGDGEPVKPVDEINMFYDCRYVSSCEAAWRLLGYELQYKKPPVQRLSFHLKGEHYVIFEDDDRIDEVISKPTVNESQFLAWMEANKMYPEARKLTYVEAPSKFVWNKTLREWTPRIRDHAIARLRYVPPNAGDNFYLRCLVNVIRGATCLEDYMKVDNVQYSSYRDACHALGLLGDDREYIDGIAEASHWASADSLRRMFATLLVSGSLGRPEHVWETCLDFLSDDITYMQRILFNNE
ncbi:Unknown protein, partial [Striga hermonthica]